MRVEALIDRCEMLADEPVLRVETLIDRYEELQVFDEPVMRVEAVTVDGDEADEGKAMMAARVIRV